MFAFCLLLSFGREGLLNKAVTLLRDVYSLTQVMHISTLHSLVLSMYVRRLIRFQSQTRCLGWLPGSSWHPIGWSAAWPRPSNAQSARDIFLRPRWSVSTWTCWREPSARLRRHCWWPWRREGWVWRHFKVKCKDNDLQSWKSRAFPKKRSLRMKCSWFRL